MADWDESEGEGEGGESPQVKGATLAQPLTLNLSNKWEGEDEDDEVKESWEDDEDEKKDEEKKEVIAPATVTKSKTKKLAEKIAEKEQRMMEELERKLAEEEANMTPEQKAAEKLRRQKLQEEADLKLALETFGVSDSRKLDSYNPTTKEEFKEFADVLTTTITAFKSREEYPNFISGLVQSICLSLNSFDLKNVKGMLDNLYVEKQKMEKGDKSKKAGKGKGKARLNVETSHSRLREFDDFGYDDDGGDFM